MSEDEYELDEDIDLPDPYQCTIDIKTDSATEVTARRALASLLEGIDPTFQFICLRGSAADEVSSNEEDHPSSCEAKNEELNGESEQQTVVTPALAVIMFMNEHGPLSMETVGDQLLEDPWKFHHKIDITSGRNGTERCIGKQKFYQIGGAVDLPLWSICPVHAGNEHMRFTIFTRNFSAMLDFYRLLCAREVENSKPGFCLFEIFSQPGFDIQLALKYSSNLSPRPLKNSLLKMKIKSMNTIWSCLQSKPMQCGIREYLVQDPDGNNVIVEETEIIEQYTWGDMIGLTIDQTSDDVSDSLDSGRCSSFSDSTVCETDVSRNMTSHVFDLHHQNDDVFHVHKETSSVCSGSTAQTTFCHIQPESLTTDASLGRSARASMRSIKSQRLDNVKPVKF